MVLFFVILSVLVLAVCAYAVSLWPGKKRKGRTEAFQKTYIAHRGFFDNARVPENSLPAFWEAVVRGYAIELDVQLTADEELVVFHDDTLKRMCGRKQRVSELSFEEICDCSLLKTDEKIPLFEDVLRLVDGKVPLLIEIKPCGDCVKTAKSLWKKLEGYGGVYAVQSFHPAPVMWFLRKHPEVTRGILSTDYRKNNLKRPWYQQFMLTNLMANIAVRPDFVAYNHKYANNFSYRLVKKLYMLDSAAWTIRNPKDLRRAEKNGFEMIIFDSFIPEERR